MDELNNLLPWWNRQTDEKGKQIRQDVRQSAPNAWEKVCREVERVLGDRDEAGPLFEKAIRAVSTYLDRYNIEAHDPTGLLIAAVSRLAHRVARQRRRFLPIDSEHNLDLLAHAPDWSDQVNRRLLLQQLIDCLRPETQGVLRLRLEGFEWTEIGKMLNLNAGTIRKAFWREIRGAQLRLLRQRSKSRKDGTK